MKEKGAAVFGFLEIEKESNLFYRFLTLFFPKIFKVVKLIVLIHDKNKPSPVRYKNTGGRTNLNEGFIECLQREFEEEIGIDINIVSNKKEDLFWKDKGSHFFVCYRVKKVFGEMEVKDVEGIYIRSQKQVKQMLQLGLILEDHAEAISYFIEQS